ncbi:MAG TPA: alkaline phosphatase family protein [Actinomycetes bacterium]|nr:alkaline phosphatase family protein [Actinomycetes bacterium]
MTGLPSAGQRVTGLPLVGQPVSELSPERSGLPVLPYGESTLADLMPSVLAALGAPGERNPLRLRATEKACVVLVDGLGYEQLARVAAGSAARMIPELAALLPGGRVLSTGFPATTATSLGSIGTGLPPGRHGLLGYQVAVPGAGWLLNQLRWDPRVDPASWQPETSCFERAVAAGILVAHVSAPVFEGSGLTLAAFRGARYVGAETREQRATATLAELSGRGRRLVYTYLSQLDSAGHLDGVYSARWWAALAEIDRFVGTLRAGLPAGTALYITADHGLVDVPPEARIDADVRVELRAGVSLLGGEARARHVYAVPGAADDALANWRAVLGEEFWVLSRAEAIEAGLFGPQVSPPMRARIGDVVALARGSGAVVAPEAEPVESSLRAMHGSITEQERRIPLLSHQTD